MKIRRRDMGWCLGSLILLYLLPHAWDMWGGLLLGVAFALVLIGSSCPSGDPAHLARYALYLSISAVTYRLLFEDRVWEPLDQFLPQWLTGEPFIVCSVVMSVAGWLLLERRVDRVKYLWVTLFVQIPFSLIFDHPSAEAFLRTSGGILRYTDPHAGTGQTWQFFWMVNYYLPVFFWNRRTKIGTIPT